MILLNALKRLIYGTTTHFSIIQSSCALRGTSFINLWSERTEYPCQIVAIDIKVEGSNKTEFRICASGKKIFPFADFNTVPNGLVNIIPVDVAAGELLSVEVKGMSASDKFVVILSELDLIEKR